MTLPFDYLVKAQLYGMPGSLVNSAKTLDWKSPKPYKEKRWWIEYQFCIPEELRRRYKGAK